jgi:hypothetical protein
MEKEIIRRLIREIAALLIAHDHKNQANAISFYENKFNSNQNPDTKLDARGVLQLFSGWGSISDVVLSGENGPLIAENETLMRLSSQLTACMKSLI